MPQIEFGDNVRVLSSPETEAAKVSGLAGQVYGFTTPSETRVNDVIGGTDEDYAINVHLDGHGALWFHPRLLEFIDHGPGTTIEIAGHRFVRSTDGQWAEPGKPWWKFW